MSIGSGAASGLRAADPAFVGVLALAAENDVAEQLQLSDETRQQLLDLIDRREREALSLVLDIRDLPASEVAQRLEPFVEESERQGMALLTVAQRERLQQLQVARMGMLSLLEPDVVEILGLTQSQQEQIRRLVRQRADDGGRAPGAQRRLTEAVYDRRLSDVLTDDQLATWQRMAGRQNVVTRTPRVAVNESADVDPREVAGTAPSGDGNSRQLAERAENDNATEPPPGTEVDLEPREDSPLVATEEAQDAVAQDAVGVGPDAAVQQPGDAEVAAPVEADESAEEQAGEADERGAAEPIDERPAGDEFERLQPLRDDVAPPATAEPSQLDEDLQPDVRPSHDGEPLLRFSFYQTPWSEVLEWFADEADLAMQFDIMPPGTLTYSDPGYFTPPEALDLMNSVLLTKGYTLLRRNKILMVVDLEDEIPTELVELVPLEELDRRGTYELVKTLFQLARMDPEAAEADISRLIGPQGRVIVMPSARQVLVQETAGKLRTIRAMIERVEDPRSARKQGVVPIELEHITAAEVLAVARPLLGLAEGENTNEDISLSIDALGTRIFARGTQDSIEQLEQIVRLVDRAEDEMTEARQAIGQPTLETYPIVVADPDLVLKVTQTLLAGTPGVRLSVDEATRKLVAFAHPEEHQLIEATLRRMEGYAPEFDVIALQYIDPMVAAMTINKFMRGGMGEEAADPNAPIVDGDPTTMRLWVRGTSEQLAQIRDLVDRLEDSARQHRATDTLRFVPFSGRAGQSALAQAEEIWSNMRRNNRIRTVTPSAISPSIRQESSPATPQTPRFEGPVPPSEFSPPDFSPPQGDRPEARREPAEDDDDVAHHRDRVQVRFVQLREPAGENQHAGGAPGSLPRNVSTPAPRRPLRVDLGELRHQRQQMFIQEQAARQQEQQLRPQPERETDPNDRGSDIIISVTPNGIFITSEDPEALDEFERLLRSIMEQDMTGGLHEPTVFYLKYARASSTADLLREILGGAPATTGGNLMSDMAAGMFGDMIGGLLAGGDTITPSGDVSIVPDNRLNALIVQANPLDLDLIEQLLEVIDQESSPEIVETHGRPRLIPVMNMAAEEMAEVVRSVFANRLDSPETRQQQRGGGPSAQELIQALRGGGDRGGGRGGRGGGGGGRNERTETEEQKMTISVDNRSNSLIVAASEPLYQEVKMLVEQIDEAAATPDEVSEVYSLGGNVNSEVVQRALQSLIDPNNERPSNNERDRPQRRTRETQRRAELDGGGGSGADRQGIEALRSMQREAGGGAAGFGRGGGTGGFEGFRGGGGGTRGGGGGTRGGGGQGFGGGRP